MSNSELIQDFNESAKLIQDSDESAPAMPSPREGSRPCPQSSPESIELVTPLTDSDT